jgi:hypothetical protein
MNWGIEFREIRSTGLIYDEALWADIRERVKGYVDLIIEEEAKYDAERARILDARLAYEDSLRQAVNQAKKF